MFLSVLQQLQPVSWQPFTDPDNTQYTQFRVCCT